MLAGDYLTVKLQYFRKLIKLKPVAKIIKNINYLFLNPNEICRGSL